MNIEKEIEILNHDDVIITTPTTAAAPSATTSSTSCDRDSTDNVIENINLNVEICEQVEENQLDTNKSTGNVLLTDDHQDNNLKNLKKIDETDDEDDKHGFNSSINLDDSSPPPSPLVLASNSRKRDRTQHGHVLTVDQEEPIIVDVIAEDAHLQIRKIRHVKERSLSAGRIHNPARRVSFPENDKELVTGYLEPANPWASVKPVACVSELAELYRASCEKHNSLPIDTIIKHLDTLDLTSKQRRPILNLRQQTLTAESCEALEEVLKRVQYKLIDLTDCKLNDISATALFDMIEYYEAANEIDISENRNISNRGWQSCINMIKRSHALQILATRCTPLSENNAINLGKAMLGTGSSLHTIKLEHCGLSGRPIASLCNYLKRNTVLKELWLAHNDLNSADAFNIGSVLKSNFYLQFLDVSNNSIEDVGVHHLTEALMEQTKHFKQLQDSITLNNNISNSLSSSLTASPLSSPSSNGATNDLNTSTTTTTTTAAPSSTAQLTPSQNLDKIDDGYTYLGSMAVQRSVLETLLQQTHNNRQHHQSPTTIKQPPPPPVEQCIEDFEFDFNIPSLNATTTKSVENVSKEEVTESAAQSSPQKITNNTIVNNNNEIKIASAIIAADDKQPEVKLLDLNELLLPLIDADDGDEVAADVQLQIIEDDDGLRKNIEQQDDVELINNNQIEKLMEDEMLAEGCGKSVDSGVGGEPVEQNEDLIKLVEEITNDGANDDLNCNINEMSSLTHDFDNCNRLDCVNEDDDIEKDLIILEDNLSVTPPTVASTVVAAPPSELSIVIEEESMLSGDDDDDSFSSVDAVVEEKQIDLDVNTKVQIASNNKVNVDIENEEIERAVDAAAQLTNIDDSNIVIDKKIENKLPLLEQLTSTPSPEIRIPNSLISLFSPIEPKKQIELSPTLPPPTPPPQPTLPPTAAASTNIPSTILQSDSSLSLTSNTSMSSSFCNDEVFTTLTTPPPISFAEKAFQQSSTPIPERSFSSESLNSETSIESNDSKSSLRLAEAKFSRNGTLERQQQQQTIADQTGTTTTALPHTPNLPQTPSGLQVLVLWNNRITRDSARSISDLIGDTNTLEILNIGRNVLSNDFLTNIKTSLKSNTSLTSLGLQSAHLTCTGIKTLTEMLEFGGNSTLQRIDLRDNHIQVNGLTALNSVLKSNKSLTRIDLDDVPRRNHDQGTDSVIDYSRMVNNIRAQCARNENPPEPEPVRTTAIKRCRANFLNSRKISLTCQSIRTADGSPSVGTVPVTGQANLVGKNMTERNLLDPNNRKNGGRLRSPLPSPIPSPVSSPIPSPSRHRFQVSRVVESTGVGKGGGNTAVLANNNSSTTSPIIPLITPPSSNSCSPTTGFFTSRASRFRVTTVLEPATAKTVATNPPTQFATINNITLPTTTVSTPTPTPSPLKTKSTSIPVNISNLVQQTNVVASAALMNPTTITTADTATVATTNTAVKSQECQTTNLPTSSILLHNKPLTFASVVAGSLNNPSELSTFSNNSFDSPDLEVKQYMDDSCSSISSMDSIDRHHDFNVSMSSMESFDLVLVPQNPNKSPSLSMSSTSATAPSSLTKKLSSTQAIDGSNSGVSSLKIHDSLSSLETSTCSTDSLYDQSHYQNQDDNNQPVPIILSSNEGTLTNSPCSLSCLDDKSALLSKQQLAPQQQQQEKRVRKTSWISNPISTREATIEKLMSIFQNPGKIFTRTSNNEITADQPEKPSSKPPSRKESPMGGLFASWTGSSTAKIDDTQNVGPTESPTKIPKSPLQANISPENTVTVGGGGGGVAVPIVTADCLSGKLKQEMKENISPEHTITAVKVVDVKSQPLPVIVAGATIIEKCDKVRFELGGGDEDSDDENVIVVGGGGKTPPDPSFRSSNLLHHGLGQITRDSLSILKGSGSTNSQDSMRSLESLSEVDRNLVFESPIQLSKTQTFSSSPTTATVPSTVTQSPTITTTKSSASMQ